MTATPSTPSVSLQETLIAILKGQPGFLPSLLRLALTPLAALYSAGLWLYLLPFGLGIRHKTKLTCPVISIGNLTTGGTGKTPTTAALCRMLTDRGMSTVILSRGYGGANEHGCAIASDGHRVRLTAQMAGDEACMLAHMLPTIPVLVGKDRRQSGARAEAEFRPDVIVMDDGMQYWQLHRNVEIVLLDAIEPFDNGYTLPRGLLREPAPHLRRATVILVTRSHVADRKTLDQTMAKIRSLAPGKPVYTADLIPHALRQVEPPQLLDIHSLRGRRVACLSAIGNPSSFESMLGDLGSIVCSTMRLPDHSQPSAEELDALFRRAEEANASAIVTTEKDAIKLDGRSYSLPIVVLQVTMHIDSAEKFLNSILEAL